MNILSQIAVVLLLALAITGLWGLVLFLGYRRELKRWLKIGKPKPKSELTLSQSWKDEGWEIREENGVSYKVLPEEKFLGRPGILRFDTPKKLQRRE